MDNFYSFGETCFGKQSSKKCFLWFSVFETSKSCYVKAVFIKVHDLKPHKMSILRWENFYKSSEKLGPDPARFIILNGRSFGGVPFVLPYYRKTVSAAPPQRAYRKNWIYDLVEFWPMRDTYCANATLKIVRFSNDRILHKYRLDIGKISWWKEIDGFRGHRKKIIRRSVFLGNSLIFRGS